jgi:hypothetical protein
MIVGSAIDILDSRAEEENTAKFDRCQCTSQQYKRVYSMTRMDPILSLYISMYVSCSNSSYGEEIFSGARPLSIAMKFSAYMVAKIFL